MLSKKVLILAALLVILLSQTAFALSFADETCTDFSSYGSQSTNIVCPDGEMLTLREETIGLYVTNGSFISRVFDANETVLWKNLTSVSVMNQSEHNLTFFIRLANESFNWTVWMEAADFFNKVGRYAQYMAVFNTTNIHSTPRLDSVLLSYDYIIPTITLVSPPNNYITSNGTIEFNCSATSNIGLKNITFYWNHSGIFQANETINVSGTSASVIFRKNILNESAYLWTCSASNNISRTGFGENRTFLLNYTTRINVSIEISPIYIAEGGNVTIISNISSIYPLDSIWAEIIMPNGTKATFMMINGSASYTAPLPGTYNVTVFANDTRGNIGLVSSNFSASDIVDIVFDALFLGNFSPVEVSIYYLNTQSIAYSFTAADNNFTTSIIRGKYDMNILVFNRSLEVILKGVDISNRITIRFDRTSVAGFAETYAIESTLPVNTTIVKIHYRGSKNILNESHISLYRCSMWDFYNRSCNSPWEKIESILDEDNDVISTLELSGFSAFSIKQDPFCGDGICDHSADENNINCQSDCKCPTGEQRACGTSNVGECRKGIQTCINGIWDQCVGAIEPTEEICNGKDDNCDGIIDNIEGKIGIEQSRCRCYGGGQPMTESCNNIDDDCDGQIDEGLQRECGTNKGICEFGLSSCINGRWGECTGGITSRGIEICGNGLDDDCDGETDENCPNCFNKKMDGDEEGIDCGGICPKKCPEFPWMLFIEIGAAVVIIAFAAYMKSKKSKDKWGELEQKYSYEPREGL